ncbi:MAG TPA: histidinol-phosphatase HisJ family protein [Candidatus Dormibacteraeota bacterium]
MPRPIPDHHVHTEWSWDASHGSMDRSCRRALALGLPSIAFTEHADWVRGPGHVVQAAAYLECIERCRSKYPGLRILSGIELGEPHRHAQEAADLARSGTFDRLLGSVHCVTWKGTETDASSPGFLTPQETPAIFRAYLRDTQEMLERPTSFEVLGHLDYPHRYWPADQLPYDEREFEEELRAVLRAAAKRQTALEVNTTRGRILCPGPTTLRWWYEEGGEAVAFGSDAHSPDMIAAGFRDAAQIVEQAGFKAQDDPSAFWRR